MKNEEEAGKVREKEWVHSEGQRIEFGELMLVRVL